MNLDSPRAKGLIASGKSRDLVERMHPRPRIGKTTKDRRRRPAEVYPQPK